ncbi:hypothetical protein RF11_01134 [Thelohanellus kitauei]|uniref:Uncharacterized protein n=1 Tax=Thelohanellus kitauei TaxID=669202 RepID=A0A0C2MIZ7_THEKT|nr:hypothetical protein RF11_01134 [Thelohanellus kitauei]
MNLIFNEIAFESEPYSTKELLFAVGRVLSRMQPRLLDCQFDLVKLRDDDVRREKVKECILSLDEAARYLIERCKEFYSKIMARISLQDRVIHEVWAVLFADIATFKVPETMGKLEGLDLYVSLHETVWEVWAPSLNEAIDEGVASP